MGIFVTACNDDKKESFEIPGRLSLKCSKKLLPTHSRTYTHDLQNEEKAQVNFRP